MNSQIKQQWINDLRSGNFKQTVGQLMEEIDDETKGFCCLGVLTDQYLKDTGKSWDDNMEGSNYKHSSEGILAREVRNWAGLYERDPSVVLNGKLRCLSSLNDDDCMTFSEIADIIEANDFEPV